MAKPNFAQNLRTACNLHPSVAHVCRSLEMNRQQFNKYLSGQIFPSRHSLARICGFFKLSEAQFALNQDEFEGLVAKAGHPGLTDKISEIDSAIDNLPNMTEALSRYEGYYYLYFHALGFPGSLIRSLAHVFRHQNRFYTKSIEHLWNKERAEPRHLRFKYRGIVHYMGDRIFITEQETLTKNAICHTILFPSYRNVVDTLSGITCGVGSLNSHMPKATRVEYKFLGKQIDLREGLGGCGLFDLDSKAISDEIKSRVSNEMAPGDFMLTARDQ